MAAAVVMLWTILVELRMEKIPQEISMSSVLMVLVFEYLICLRID